MEVDGTHPAFVAVNISPVEGINGLPNGVVGQVFPLERLYVGNVIEQTILHIKLRICLIPVVKGDRNKRPRRRFRRCHHRHIRRRGFRFVSGIGRRIQRKECIIEIGILVIDDLGRPCISRAAQIGGKRHKAAPVLPCCKIIRIIIGKTGDIRIEITASRRIVEHHRIGAVDRDIGTPPQFAVIRRLERIVKLFGIIAVVIRQFVCNFAHGFRAAACRKRHEEATRNEKSQPFSDPFHFLLLKKFLLFLAAADVDALDEIFLHKYIQQDQGEHRKQSGSALCVGVTAAVL